MKLVEVLLALWQRHRDDGILVDTNLLLIYLVGRLDPRLLSRGKRTADFREQDLPLLVRFVRGFKRVYTTTSILTEVFNLMPDDVRYRNFQRLTKMLAELRELTPTLESPFTQNAFRSFGFADATVAATAEQGHLVLSQDAKLNAYLRQHRLDALSFSDLLQLTRDSPL